MKETTLQHSSVSPTCCPQGTVTQGSTEEQPPPSTPAAAQPRAGTLLTAEEEDEKTMQRHGVLTEEEVCSCVSNLGQSATGQQHIYQFLSVAGRNLNDVSILRNYVHLQKLELPYNKIKDLSCVSHMPYLVILDASHNELTNFFGFQPPKNLKEVNLSHNRMSVMKDLSAYSSLSKLKLDYNRFSQIRGLGRCTSLTHLSLAHNKISRISGLDHLPLRELCLKGNQIVNIENMETLRTLQVLDLSLNKIQSLSGLQNLPLLGSISLENNLISEVREAGHLDALFLLRDLNLLSNPVQDQPDYRLAVLFLLQHLTGLDQEKVTAEEKVSSVNKYDPPMEVVAARDHMTHMVYQLMQPQVLYDSTLPSLDSPYPLLVLTGPQACGKRELAHKLCLDFNDFFAYGACHTTRGPYTGEEDGSDYHFVTEEDFQNMIHMGKFIQTMQYGGHRYGLSRGAVEEVAREGLACCVHMELEGVFSLKNTYFEPRYILLIPTDQEKYARRLKTRGLYTGPQIYAAIARIGLYARVNRERPGFFDNVIRCDDPDEAYKTLGQVVKQYLGLEEDGRGEDEGTRTTPDNNTSTGDQDQSARATPDNDASTELPRRGESPAEEEGGEAPFSQSEPGPTSAPAPALDMSASSCRNYYNKVKAQLAPKRTSAELASMQRRQQLVREALMGKSPGAYSQLFKRSVQTAQSSLASQIQDPALSSPRIPRHNQSEDSSDESRASSGLSVPNSAGAFSKSPGPARCSDVGSSPTVEPLDVSSLGHPLDTLKDQVEHGHTPDGPRPGSELLSPSVTPAPARPGSELLSPSVTPTPARPGSELLSPSVTPTPARPGSNAKPVLPPIPSGRKTPAHSPSPGPGPAPKP